MKSSRRSFVKQGLLAGAAVVPAPVPAQAASPRSAGERFRQLLQGSDVLQCPVVFDALSAKMSEDLGFPAVYAGGQPVSASMYGVGDFGTLTMTELIEFAGRIAGVVDIPVVGDADDGGGNPLNVHRTIQSYERAGVASVMIEDMYGAKHLPGLPEGPMSSIPAFVDKIKAAVDARKHGLVLIARSDALSAKEPFEKGVERLAAYAEAGADVVFLAGAPIRRSPELAKASSRPVMTVTMPGDPDSSLEVVRASGVKVACYAYQLMAVAMGAVQRALRDIQTAGRIQRYEEIAVSSQEYARIVGASKSVDIARRFNAGGGA
ncbi:MAG TPA: isocitrate lyase/PEP mutase family protein [Vicinamibacteria bacterium]|nr:isocitrate lyase/PEP mutase family protein [Vicinamibacteria bacterium]